MSRTFLHSISPGGGASSTSVRVTDTEAIIEHGNVVRLTHAQVETLFASALNNLVRRQRVEQKRVFG